MISSLQVGQIPETKAAFETGAPLPDVLRMAQKGSRTLLSHPIARVHLPRAMSHAPASLSLARAISTRARSYFLLSEANQNLSATKARSSSLHRLSLVQMLGKNCSLPLRERPLQPDLRSLPALKNCSQRSDIDAQMPLTLLTKVLASTLKEWLVTEARSCLRRRSKAIVQPE